MLSCVDTINNLSKKELMLILKREADNLCILDYIKASEFREFAGEVVPLVEMDKIVWINKEIFKADVKFANFGPVDINNATIKWTLKANRSKFEKSGELTSLLIPTGKLSKIGDMSVPLTDLNEAVQLKLTISLAGTRYQNNWDIWAYPDHHAEVKIDSIIVCENMEDQIGSQYHHPTGRQDVLAYA